MHAFQLGVWCLQIGRAVYSNERLVSGSHTLALLRIRLEGCHIGCRRRLETTEQQNNTYRSEGYIGRNRFLFLCTTVQYAVRQNCHGIKQISVYRRKHMVKIRKAGSFYLFDSNPREKESRTLPPNTNYDTSAYSSRTEQQPDTETARGST